MCAPLLSRKETLTARQATVELAKLYTDLEERMRLEEYITEKHTLLLNFIII